MAEAVKAEGSVTSEHRKSSELVTAANKQIAEEPNHGYADPRRVDFRGRQPTWHVWVVIQELGVVHMVEKGGSSVRR